MRGDLYQFVLIVLGICVAALFGAFLYREVYPEYKIYQEDYVALEEFRSTYTGQPPPAFKYGIKQIVLKAKDQGPETIDRCTSCHIALKFEHFSPTKVAYDINGNIKLDADGFPIQVPNENYVWLKLDQAIASLRNEETNDRLRSEGKDGEVQKRLALANKYESYKTATVGEHTYDVTKALRMHPLIGRETYPFEYHPIDEYGCTSCHSGNGRGLTTQKAHGPVFDGKYEVEFMGPTPKFLEKDEKNDPRFATIFNHKPGHELLFQTTPILIGSLMEAKCVHCHKTGIGSLEEAYSIADMTAEQRKAQSNAIKEAYTNEIEALISLIDIKKSLQSEGYDATLAAYQEKADDIFLTDEEVKAAKKQVSFLLRWKSNPKALENEVDTQIFEMVGSPELVNKLIASTKDESVTPELIKSFVNGNRTESQAKGTLFGKADAVNLEKEMLIHVQDTEKSFRKTVSDERVINAMTTDIDLMTSTFQDGKQLFISQACYACHRIAGLSRGGVGPDLTEEGKKYPWFIKESIAWPQADLKTSTMPNFKLDHTDLESLMTYLLAQTGETKSEAEVGRKMALQEWEAGKKVSFEKPISPAKIHDLDYAMEVFATEGCAACHRLKGFTSNVGFAVEKENKDVPFDTIYNEREWFAELFPEEIPGSKIVATIEEHQQEIDQRIVDGVRDNSILEKIESKNPDAINSLYSNFRYASRAKNHDYEERINNESDPAKKRMLQDELEAWKERVHRVLMMYVQEHGLGRLVGPKPNWAGIYRSDEWLMEHFRNPASHIARSIMPVFPFDDSKFYALTYMLDTLGVRNRDEVRQIWKHRGFNPQQAYQIFCAQCHGPYMQGNGPVSEWIYPIPKSLRNADFLRNLTKSNVYKSIAHGVKGTPMPPWSEVGQDKPNDNIPVITTDEAQQLVDWIFSSLPGAKVIRGQKDVPKWQYTPEDVIDELKREGGQLKPEKKVEKEEKEALAPELTALPNGDGYYAATTPKVYVNESNKTANGVEVSKYFDVVPHPVPGEDRDAYYIKRKYYTPKNLMAGKAYFELNCAVCHGREGDGAGNRAGSMVDAKPRMLTNLDWLDTRDDLRLLRSIKYGVPGTAMVAWGDQTSSLQRMQLVMFVRTISAQAKLRDKLMTNLYKAFDRTEQTIETIRIEVQPRINILKGELEQIKQEHFTLQGLVELGEVPSEKALKIYKKQLSITNELNQLNDVDQTTQQLTQEVKKEKGILQSLGLSIIAQSSQRIDPEKFYKLLCVACDRYTYEDGKLTFHEAPEEKIEKAGKEISENVESAIKRTEEELVATKGKIRSPERDEEVKDLESRLAQLKKLKVKVASSFYHAKESRKKQQELVERLNKELQIVKQKVEKDDEVQ